MQKLKIAIVGAGTGGLAAAAFLKRSDHDVIIFEKFPAPKPIGAGLMLQPTGLAVLAKLELDKKIIEQSCPIYNLDGRVAQSNKCIFNLSYHTLNPKIFGLGTYRATLFQALYDGVLAQQVPIICSTTITDMLYDENGLAILLADEKRLGPFDLVIDAQGSNSRLRELYAEVLYHRPYPYAAIWGVCIDHDGQFSRNTLMQRYVAAHHMIGVMPMGKAENSESQRVAFFWSLRAKEYDAWRQRGLAAWREDVTKLWPETESLVQQFTSVDDLAFATYRDVILRKWHGNRLAFIGDAAHCGSPQLGQGANMALIGAMILDECLAQQSTLDAALAAYTQRRRKHVRFYQTASRWLTPFFQSDDRFMPYLRDLTFGSMCRLPYIKMEMIRTLAGLKTGLFSRLNPGAWHADYAVK